MISSLSFPKVLRADDADETVMINVPYLATGGKVLNWKFPYSDDYFRQDPDVFNLELAKASMGLTVSAFRNNGKFLEDQYETYLSAAGFKGITPFGYDKPTGVDTLSGVVAYKTIDDFTLIAAVPCGQGYKNEWAGNLEVGY
ncbi:MAG: hypothetical protein E7233_05715, partial [Lachnospiraceae bacterium]|nr:hypothetical protein [Lachnospiraceae bacterium]